MKRFTAAVYLLVIASAALVGAGVYPPPGAGGGGSKTGGAQGPSPTDLCVEITTIDHGGITDAHVSGTYVEDDPNAIAVVEDDSCDAPVAPVLLPCSDAAAEEVCLIYTETKGNNR